MSEICIFYRLLLQRILFKRDTYKNICTCGRVVKMFAFWSWDSDSNFTMAYLLGRWLLDNIGLGRQSQQVALSVGNLFKRRNSNLRKAVWKLHVTLFNSSKKWGCFYASHHSYNQIICVDSLAVDLSCYWPGKVIPECNTFGKSLKTSP